MSKEFEEYRSIKELEESIERIHRCYELKQKWLKFILDSKPDFIKWVKEHDPKFVCNLEGSSVALGLDD